MNAVPIKNKVTERSASWSKGTGVMSAPGTDQSSGGGALSLPFKGRTVLADGGGASAGGHRLNGQRERHHNGGTTSIKAGSTSPSR